MYLFLLFFLVSQNSSPVESSCAKLLPHFMEEVKNGKCEPGWCGRNINNFIENLNKKDVSLNGSYVLFIEKLNSKGRSQPFRPAKPKHRETREWFAHYVIEADDQILDFYFTKSARPISKQEYFKQMFPKDWQKLTIRRIPAADFISLYKQIDPPLASSDKIYGSFEPQAVEEYLRSN